MHKITILSGYGVSTSISKDILSFLYLHYCILSRLLIIICRFVVKILPFFHSLFLIFPKIWKLWEYLCYFWLPQYIAGYQMAMNRTDQQSRIKHWILLKYYIHYIIKCTTQYTITDRQYEICAFRLMSGVMTYLWVNLTQQYCFQTVFKTVSELFLKRCKNVWRAQSLGCLL